VPQPSSGGSLPDEASQPTLLQQVLNDRILTAPNVITVSRLFLLPVFVWLLFGRDDPTTAAIVLGVMGATDWVDGQVARHWGQVSELGKILDPAADRIVLLVSVIAIVAKGAVPAWIAVPVLVREPIMFVAVPVLALLGARRIDVTWVGKAGTFALMFAFPLFLLGSADASFSSLANALAYCCAVPGIVLSWYATFTYVPLARTALREGRSAAGRTPSAA
jgi:cardiolipin synthase